jgi:hypothetical protein
MHFFYATIFLDITLNTVAVFFGLRACRLHQVSSYKNFSVVYGVCIISRVILAYVNTYVA